MRNDTRLDELEEQRMLVQRQLAWLDREIAAERNKLKLDTGAHPAPTILPAPASLAPAASVTRPTLPAPTYSSPTSDAFVMETPRPANEVRQDVKKGCLLYFAAAIAAVIVSVAILYFTFGIGRR